MTGDKKCGADCLSDTEPQPTVCCADNGGDGSGLSAVTKRRPELVFHSGTEMILFDR